MKKFDASHMYAKDALFNYCSPLMEQQTNILKTVFSVSIVFSQTVSDDIGNSNFYDLCVCAMREKTTTEKTTTHKH